MTEMSRAGQNRMHVYGRAYAPYFAEYLEASLQMFCVCIRPMFTMFAHTHSHLHSVGQPYR